MNRAYFLNADSDAIIFDWYPILLTYATIWILRGPLQLYLLFSLQRLSATHRAMLHRKFPSAVLAQIDPDKTVDYFPVQKSCLYDSSFSWKLPDFGHSPYWPSFCQSKVLKEQFLKVLLIFCRTVALSHKLSC